jgi:thiol-disulfide isomerase/thioredoxin
MAEALEDSMPMRHVMPRLAIALAAALITGGGPASAERVKLSDGSEFSGQVVQRTAESVVVVVPRKSVASIDGERLPPPILEGSAAPDFTAADMTGATQSLQANRGSVTLVQFWASWCPYCRKDLSLVKALVRQYEGRGLKLVTVSIDEDMDKLKAFLRAEALAYPVIVGADAARLSALYEASGVPAYFLVGRDGMLTGVWRGSVTASAKEGQPTELEEQLAALLPAGT